MTKLIGTDVSFYQDSSETDAQIDFKKMVTKTPFVIIRAGQNLWIDPDFLWNMKEAKAAGLLRGSYWFYDSRVNPKTQAALYSSLVTQDHGELPMFADFEDRYNGPYGGWNNWYNFLEELKVLSPGVQLGVYTGPSYWLENTVVKNIPSMSLSYFGQYPLWIAHYGVDSPSVVMPWSKWEFWQFTDNGDGTLYGVESLNIDLNYFNGTEEDLNRSYGLPSPIPPTEEVLMYKIKLELDPVKTTSPYLNLREAPSTAAKDIGNFDRGSVAKGDALVESATGDLWFKALEINGKVLAAPAYIASWYCKLSDIVPEVEPVFGKIRLDAVYASDGPFVVTNVDGTVVYESPVTGGTLNITSIEKEV